MPTITFCFPDIEGSQIHLIEQPSHLLIRLGSSGGDGNAGTRASRGTRRQTLQRFLSVVTNTFPGVRLAGYRVGEIADNKQTKVDGLLGDHVDSLVAAFDRGGANAFDLWLEESWRNLEDFGNRLRLQRHTRQSHLQKLVELDAPQKTAAPQPQAPSAPTDASTGEGTIPLPKAFILLAGISGTGKTRFVREQALRGGERFFKLIPVRPDWHEPSELLGHFSRLHGERFLPTPFLKFVAEAWKDAAARADADAITLHPLDRIHTFWACLDEMNLAPVEQYLADYLSVSETRQWNGKRYTCDPILSLHDRGFSRPVLEGLRAELGLAAPEHEGLWLHFSARGIPLPPNLVVAGTVNVDETAHGFSRKVIDRAFTLDFGAFFPTDFSKYFESAHRPVRFAFPRRSRVTRDDLAGCCDPDGARSIEFLEDVNGVLRHTPFELAYRALNELLLAVHTFAPQDEGALRGVWDDFLMTKVLPRLEGDAEKLRLNESESLLTRLRAVVTKWVRDSDRPDHFRRAAGGDVVTVPVRAAAALDRMQERLVRQRFTSFWP